MTRFYGAPFVTKLFAKVLFNVVVTYPIKWSCDNINQPLLFFTLISFYGSWCNIFYLDIVLLPWWNIFYLETILLPWCNIFYLDIVLLPWHNIFYLDIILLPWCDIFYLDIILLPWCNIFYLDIILLPWCHIFYLDIILLPWCNILYLDYYCTAVMRHFLPWFHFTAVMYETFSAAWLSIFISFLYDRDQN